MCHCGSSSNGNCWHLTWESVTLGWCLVAESITFEYWLQSSSLSRWQDVWVGCTSEKHYSPNFLVLWPKLTLQNKDKKIVTTNTKTLETWSFSKGAKQKAVVYTWGKKKRTLSRNDCLFCPLNQSWVKSCELPSELGGLGLLKRQDYLSRISHFGIFPRVHSSGCKCVRLVCLWW